MILSLKNRFDIQYVKLRILIQNNLSIGGCQPFIFN